MPRIGCLGRIIIVALAFFVLLIVGRLVFPLPTMPHVQLAAEGVFSVFGFPITNTMLASWLTILVLGALCYAATRRLRLVPRGLQNVMEGAIEALLNFVEGVAGKEYGRRFFPVVATIFIFIIANAWLALVPGFMAIWVGEEHVPLLRGANTDINLPLALALVSFVFVEYWGVRSHGFLRYIGKFFNLRQLFRGMALMLRGRLRSGMGGLFTGIVDAFVGLVEIISELARIISFTFRLFGNMTAGELLLLMMLFLLPWVAAIPFYGLELFLGFVQALIFGGLTLVFLVIAVTPREEGH